MNNDFLLRIFLHCHSWQKTLFSSALKTHLSSYVYVQEFAFIKGRNFCTKTSLEFTTHWNTYLVLLQFEKPEIDIFFLFRGCKGGIFVLAWKVIHSPKEHGNFFPSLVWWFAWKLSLIEATYSSVWSTDWQFTHTQIKSRVRIATFAQWAKTSSS